MPLRCIMGEIKSLKTKIPDAGEGLLTGHLPRLPSLSKIKNLRVPLLNVVWKVIGPGPVWTLMNHLVMSKVPSRRALGCWLPPCPWRHEDMSPDHPSADLVMDYWWGLCSLTWSLLSDQEPRVDITVSEQSLPLLLDTEGSFSFLYCQVRVMALPQPHQIYHLGSLHSFRELMPLIYDL